MNPFTPKLRGKIDAGVEAEIVRAFDQMYNHFHNQLKELQAKTAIQETRVRQIESSPLFAAGLAAPLIEPTGTDLATIAPEGTLVVSDIPNLPASKITSGQIPLARLDGDVLKTDDNLSKTLGAPVADGFVIIKDNGGNLIKVITTA
jgi:hypothetical protein